MTKQRFFITFLLLFFTQFTQLHALEYLRSYVGRISQFSSARLGNLKSNLPGIPSVSGVNVGRNLGIRSSRILAEGAQKMKLTHAFDTDSKKSLNTLGTQLITAASLFTQLENIKVEHKIESNTLKQSAYVASGLGFMACSIGALKSLSNHFLEKGNNMSPAIGAAVGAGSLFGLLAGFSLVHYSDRLSK